MKRTIILLATCVVALACDLSDPVEPVELDVAVLSELAEAGIGAVLLSVEGAMEDVRAEAGWALVHSEADRTVVALVSPDGRKVVRLRMTSPDGRTPEVDILQVADTTDQPYASTDGFTIQIGRDD